MASYDDRAGRRYDGPREARYDTPPREARYDAPREARYDAPREARYTETRETYRGPAPGQELVPRTRNDSEFSVEAYEQHERDIRHARSADPYYDDYYDRYDNRAIERHRSKKGHEHNYEYSSHERSRRRVMSKEQKIMAALAGAALFAGGKELYDRYEAKEDGTEKIHRNPLASAALGAAGALAGYQGAEMYEKHGSKTSSKSKQLVRARDERGWESDDSDSEHYHEKGNKNFIEKAIAAAGLGSALKAMNNHDNRSERSERDTRSERSYRTRSRRGSRSSSRSSRRSESGPQRIQQAAMASLLAGASEAFRVSKEPGSWKGEKSKRILTAAISAGGIGAAHDSSKHEKLGLMESVLGGLLANRAIRGSKKDIEEDHRTGRSRSRSRARSRSAHGGGASAIAGPLAAIAGAMAAKKAVTRSRSRGDRRDDSTDSRRSFRDRSRSAVRKGLAKMGLGSESDRYDEEYREEYREEGRHHRRHRDHDDDDRSRSRSASRREKQRYESDSDSGNTDDDEKQYRKKRGKSIITTGLATVATIHAMHSVAQGYGKRQQRQKAVKAGKVSPEEAKKLKGKALFQDAASIGLAALGVTEAISELKEAKEMNDERKHWKEEKRHRHERRVARQQQQRGAEYHPRRREDGYYTTSPARSRRYNDGDGHGYE